LESHSKELVISKTINKENEETPSSWLDRGFLELATNLEQTGKLDEADDT
jgi:hypothetical protein